MGDPVSDRAIEATRAAAAAPQTGARPYGWIGLVVSIVALVILSILVWVAGVLLLFAAEIPIEGWQRVSARLTEVYRIEKGADVGAYMQLPLVLLIDPWKTFTPTVQTALLALVILLQLSVTAALGIIVRFRGGTGWRNLVAWHPWSFRNNVRLFLILLVVALVLNEAGGLLTNYLYPGPNDTVPSFGAPFVLSALSNIVMAAIMEELIMRGWLYTGLRAKLSVWPTILITSVIFALMHSISSVQDILATLPLGVAAGYLRERTGSVRAAMAFHMLHNGAIYVLLLA
jgi:membrane protease YdiL (CAAX protease family)